MNTKYTLPVAINQLLGVFGDDVRLAYAASVLALIPMLIMYALMQRWLQARHAGRRGQGLMSEAPMKATLFMGIDCGGSSTRAVLADGSGQVVGTGMSGPSNPNVLTTQATAENIRHAIESALKQANADHPNLASVFVRNGRCRG